MDSEAMAKAPKVKGMILPRPLHLGNVFLVGGHVDGPGTEEQGDLGKGVVDDMDQPALDGRRGQQGHAEDDVGELADRGIGQPGLEVVLGQGDHRGDDDGEADKIGGGNAEVEGCPSGRPRRRRA